MLALALARHGYDIAATDASPAMIAEVRRHAEHEALRLTTSVCTWQGLIDRFGPEFDLVFCGGNSIGHCRDETEMVASLAAMRSVLKPGGSLVLETRDWEALLAERVRFTCFGPRERGGRRCVPLYVWSFGEGPADAVVVEVVLPLEADGGVDLRSYRIVYHPFTMDQLVERAREAGLQGVQPEPIGPGVIRLVGSAT